MLTKNDLPEYVDCTLVFETTVEFKVAQAVSRVLLMTSLDNHLNRLYKDTGWNKGLSVAQRKNSSMVICI